MTRPLRYAIFTLPVLIGIGFACLNCSHPVKTTLVEDKKNGWSFEIPEPFVGSDGPKSNGFTIPPGFQYFEGPTEDKIQTNIVVGTRQSSETAEKTGEDIVQHPDDGQIIMDHSKYTLAGSEAYSIRATRDNGAKTQRAIFLKKGDACVVFTLTCSTKSFDKWDQVLQEALKSFRWTDAA